MTIERYEDEDIETAVEIPDQMDPGVGDRFFDGRYGSVETTSRPSISYVNESGLPDDVIDRHFNRDNGYREIANIIEQWSQSLAQPTVTPGLDMFNRNKWRNNEVHLHAVMSRVAWAVENDDTLSTLADVVEGLMWQKCRFELIDEDQQDFWNQWAETINLDEMLRQVGREEFKLSQFYVGLWWDRKIYKVQENEITEQIEEFERQRKARAAENNPDPNAVPPPEQKRGRGNHKRKKQFPVSVPTAYTVFDPTKVLPVGNLMFGRERFAYIASREEHEAFQQVMRGDVADDTVLQLIEGPYAPNQMDKNACADLGVDWNQLWLFKRDAVFRHTMTRAHYERHAPVRMKTTLPILEMKEHLRNSDRASLIGNTNFIVVITKGSDKLPAKPAEIENLKAQARIIARLPVLVGDHRLHVDIVAPPIENTLIESRYQTLDSRLVFTALKTFTPITQGGNGGGTGVSEMSRLVAKGLESRRHMIVRALEKNIFRLILERNEGILDEMPGLAFTPKRITLDFSADVIGQILKLRDRGDISRETTLEELDYDQDTEVLRRGRERVLYDPVFESQTPHSSPVTNPYGTDNQPTTSNVGPNGQPRTEGGRPAGVTEEEPRKSAQ